MPMVDKHTLQTMTIKANESLSSLIMRLKNFKMLIEATYSTAEIGTHITTNFEDDAARVMHSAIMSNARFRQDQRLFKQDASQFTWAKMVSDFGDEPIEEGTTLSDDDAEPVVTTAADGSRPEPQPVMQAQGRISTEVVQELKPLLERMLQRCDGIEQQCSDVRELAMQAKASAEEAQRGQAVLRQVIHTRLGTDVFPAVPDASQAAMVAAADSQAPKAAKPPTPSHQSAPPAPPPGASTARRLGRFNAPSRPRPGAAAPPPTTPTQNREPISTSELPEPWTRLIEALLTIRRGKGGSGNILDDNCLVCPNPRFPHPTCKCSFLWLLTAKGQAWLRARGRSKEEAMQYLQQIHMLDAYGDMDAEICHVLGASNAVSTAGLEDMQSLASELLQIQHRGWHADEGDAIIQCIECSFEDRMDA